MLSVTYSIHIDNVISHFVIWTSLRTMSYYNGSQTTQNTKTSWLPNNPEYKNKQLLAQGT